MICYIRARYVVPDLRRKSYSYTAGHESALFKKFEEAIPFVVGTFAWIILNMTTRCDFLKAAFGGRRGHSGHFPE